MILGCLYIILLIKASACEEDAVQDQCIARNKDEVCFSFVGNHDINWSDAETYCGIHFPNGGHLASVHSEKETRTLFNLTINSNPTWRDCWIGLHDPNFCSPISTPRLQNQWQWQWSDGSAVDYTHWHFSPLRLNPLREPSWSLDRRECCVEVYNGDSQYEVQWNNVRCDIMQECFICQYYRKLANSDQPESNERSEIVVLIVLLVLALIVLAIISVKHFTHWKCDLATIIKNIVRFNKSNTFQNDTVAVNVIAMENPNYDNEQSDTGY